MLNREEEQFHTPYLAWERKSETAWILPGKEAWALSWRWRKTYPEPLSKAWNLCHLTPETSPRVPAQERPSPSLHQPTQHSLSEEVGVAEGSHGIRATQELEAGGLQPQIQEELHSETCQKKTKQLPHQKAYSELGVGVARL